MKVFIIGLGLAVLLSAGAASARSARATRVRSTGDLMLPAGRSSVVGQHVLIERVVEPPVVTTQVVERQVIVERPVDRVVERVVEREVPREVVREVPGPERIVYRDRVVERRVPVGGGVRRRRPAN